MSDRLAYLNQLLEKASILEAVNMKYGLDIHLLEQQKQRSLTLQ